MKYTNIYYNAICRDSSIFFHISFGRWTALALYFDYKRIFIPQRKYKLIKVFQQLNDCKLLYLRFAIPLKDYSYIKIIEMFFTLITLSHEGQTYL